MQVAIRNPSNPSVSPSTPLWKRAPTHGNDGQALSDFMMIIPGLRDQAGTTLNQTIESIQRVFNRYSHAVVFADLNLKLNVLWVTHKPIPGMCLELATAINACVPESRLVAHKQT